MGALVDCTAVIVREGGRSSTPEMVVVEPISRGALDAPPSRSMTDGHAATFSRHNMSESSSKCLPSKERGRREDRVLAGTRGPRAEKMHGAGTTGSAEMTRPSLRDGLRAYTRSPQGPAFLPLSPARSSKRRRLDLSTGRPGPHDFAVRNRVVRRRVVSSLRQAASTASQAQRS